MLKTPKDSLNKICFNLMTLLCLTFSWRFRKWYVLNTEETFKIFKLIDKLFFSIEVCWKSSFLSLKASKKPTLVFLTEYVSKSCKESEASDVIFKTKSVLSTKYLCLYNFFYLDTENSTIICPVCAFLPNFDDTGKKFTK